MTGLGLGAAGAVPPLRPLPGLLALQDPVGRATDLARPIRFTGGIDAARSPQALAAIGVLRQIGMLLAGQRTPLIVASADLTAQAVNAAMVRQPKGAGCPWD